MANSWRESCNKRTEKMSSMYSWDCTFPPTWILFLRNNSRDLRRSKPLLEGKKYAPKIRHDEKWSDSRFVPKWQFRWHLFARSLFVSIVLVSSWSNTPACYWYILAVFPVPSKNNKKIDRLQIPGDGVNGGSCPILNWSIALMLFCFLFFSGGGGYPLAVLGRIGKI